MTKLRLATLVALLITLGVILLGAFVRLSDAGLGCPDWPGCYGHYAVPAHAADAGKAWKEMVHRYFAGSLGLIVFGLAVWSWRRGSRRQKLIFGAAAVLIVFQAALGMWTVTLRLQPLVVMGHLLGGISLASLLWLGLLETRASAAPPSLRWLAPLALAVVVAQVALGGWTSSTYSALACADFPKCNGSWWPATDFSDAFVPWRSLDVSFEHGVLAGPARVSIQLAHRLGAAVVFVVVGALGTLSIARGDRTLRAGGIALIALLMVQVTLGVSNVLFLLPMPVAVLHNGVATLLVLASIRQVFISRVSPPEPSSS
ncbi:MAG: COX15/CtaA family protein [Sorangiineae bacterium]|nr:COX15/CtaA family protein [Polyangiaceae bacterium]MEB2323624.1 COX15/CtaA family protein [Sorangiineae bacterium]